MSDLKEMMNIKVKHAKVTPSPMKGKKFVYNIKYIFTSFT